MLIGASYMSYIRPVILCGIEAFCLKEGKIGSLGMTETSMVKEMCGSLG